MTATGWARIPHRVIHTVQTAPTVLHALFYVASTRQHAANTPRVHSRLPLGEGSPCFGVLVLRFSPWVRGAEALGLGRLHGGSQPLVGSSALTQAYIGLHAPLKCPLTDFVKGYVKGCVTPCCVTPCCATPYSNRMATVHLCRDPLGRCDTMFMEMMRTANATAEIEMQPYTSPTLMPRMVGCNCTP